MDDLGTRIKQARKRRGLTQTALAELICKCPSAISGYENNTQIPPADTMLSLATALNVSLDYLVGLNTNDTYSLRGLTDNQKNIITNIIDEHKKSSIASGQLSESQAMLIRCLVNQFIKPN